jgi:hypothetical protein
MLTPIAFKLFPSEPYSEARKLTAPSRRGAKDEHLEVPSLLETMVHYVRINSESVGLQLAEEELRAARFWDPIMANTPFYFHQDGKIANRKRVLRDRARQLRLLPTCHPRLSFSFRRTCSANGRTRSINTAPRRFHRGYWSSRRRSKYPRRNNWPRTT